jgi:hypothetical protein
MKQCIYENQLMSIQLPSALAVGKSNKKVLIKTIEEYK